jgi:hypothetical protein
MPHNLELPDPVYDALQQAASASGTTPIGWIAAHLPATTKTSGISGPQNLAEALAGRIGTVHSGGQDRLSENCGEKFTDYLVQKRREGRL